MSVVKNVWVLAEKKETIAQLCAGGHQLGERVAALVFGSKPFAENALALGADQVYWLNQTESVMMEDYTEAIFKLISDKKPELILVGTSKRCKHIAGRLAACLGTAVLTDSTELAIEDGVQSTRLVYGGAAVRTEKSVSSTVLVTVGGGVFNAVPENSSRQGKVEQISLIEPKTKIKCLEKRSKGGTSVNLAAAKRVIAVGRGIANQEDLKMIEELAGLIGAEVGCTRPIAEGVNWLPRERYIGVSGVMFKPELYIAIGVSGQIQHMVGCNQSKTIFSINKDKAAPVFSQSDYSIVADLYKVVPALIEKLKK
ncbi:electron transfer flavoprotein subunit alpha/FixB family protein [Desulfitobacterium chlororespirans]|uniref:Electron transfer flavoprotein alpha subunit apoprotein n=1 Tax=Desulfitobacterium chlororespirans DSM 11544 TaxID=1121395 RepID=A0A1M7UZC6_9FIRM|nr:FAD-binding protein [Desulfitobacterium chlororespirans]SHN88266.1 electron transfer flavoprotein alpha subunit apoprotein [Desulfitobacterium chlororespirans DSM 11544]